MSTKILTEDIISALRAQPSPMNGYEPIRLAAFFDLMDSHEALRAALTDANALNASLEAACARKDELLEKFGASVEWGTRGAQICPGCGEPLWPAATKGEVAPCDSKAADCDCAAAREEIGKR